MSNLVVRVLVALVGIPLIVLVTLAGGIWFWALVLVVTLLGMHEYYRLAAAKGASPHTVPGMIAGAAVVTIFMHGKLQYLILAWFHAHGMGVPLPSMAQAFLILFLAFFPLVLALELFRKKPQPLLNTAVTLFGVGYVALFLGTLVGLRELYIPGDFPVWLYFPGTAATIPPEVEDTVYRWGGFTVLTLFVSVWVCDSAAYFAGTAWGRHKLFPRISPNKSWEGAIAGLLGAVAAFVGLRALVLPYLPVTGAVLCGVIVGVGGQIGDLAESMLKRDAGVKDSSGLIPGHGGVLDRFDSIMFAAPLVFLYLDFIVF